MVQVTFTSFIGGSDNPAGNNKLFTPEGATDYGYRAALVPGQQLYAWCCQPIMETLGQAWLDLGWSSFRCLRPVHPGVDVTITVEMDRFAAGSANFVLVNDAGQPCLQGAAGLGEGPFLATLAMPERLVPEPPTEPRIPLTPENAPIGLDLAPMRDSCSEADMRPYLADRLGTEGPPWVGPGARIHPAWLTTRMTQLVFHTYTYTPGIYVGSDVQHLAPALVGQELTSAGRFVSSYERNGHSYGVVEGVVFGEDGTMLARMRHNTIYRVARRGG